MAIAFDNKENWQEYNFATTSATKSYTVGSGDNRIICVFFHCRQGTPSAVGFTYGGVSLSQSYLDSTPQSSTRMGLFYLVAPSTGANNLVMSITGNCTPSFCVVSFSGVDQTIPLGTQVHTSGLSIGTSISNNVPSDTDEVVIDHVLLGGATVSNISATGGQTLIHALVLGTSAGAAMSSYKTGSASTTFSWSWTGSANRQESGIPLLPAAANPAPTIDSVSPASGFETGGTSITISGSDFQSGATISIGGNAVTSVVFVSATELTGVTPAGTVGAKDVVVTNPDAQADTLTGGFTYSMVNQVAVSLYVEQSRSVDVNIDQARPMDAYIEQSKSVDVGIL